jgi:phenylacetate-CoA ligase
MTEYYDARETRSEDQRREELTRDILALVSHARENAPAYGRLLADFDPAELGSLDDLARLPVTRKSELMELQGGSPPFGGLDAETDAPLKHVFVSPGPIFEPQFTRPNYWRMARTLFAGGIRPGSLVHNSFSYHLTPAGAMLNSGCHALGATVIPGGVGNTEQQIETAATLKPDAYCGTPSFLGIMLDKAQESGLNLGSIGKALVSGEAFLPVQREQFFARGIVAVQCYATADIGLIAYESSGDSAMILDEDVYLEIVRPGSGDPLPDGEVGEVVVTALNRDYPLIRFATGDLSAVLPGQSPCGRTNRRIRGWMGRADQTTKMRGMFIHPAQVNRIAARHPEIGRTRLVIDHINDSDSMTLHCECNVAQASDGLSDAIARSIRDLCKVRGDVSLVAPDSLPNDGIVIEDRRKYD